MNAADEVRFQMKRLRAQGRRPARILCDDAVFNSLLCDVALASLHAYVGPGEPGFRLDGIPVEPRKGLNGVLVLADDHVDPQGAYKPGRST